MLHRAHSISGMHDADQENISRSKGFMGGAVFTKNAQVMHHLRISYNEKGRARLFYKYSGQIKFLKNMKATSSAAI